MREVLLSAPDNTATLSNGHYCAYVFCKTYCISLGGSESLQSKESDKDSRLSHYSRGNTSDCTNPAWQAIQAMRRDSMRNALIP